MSGHSYLFFFVGGFFLSRSISRYHPDLVFNEYIKLKNPKTARIFISWHYETRPIKALDKKHRKNLTYAGLVFHIIGAVIALLSLILLLVIPPKRIEPMLFSEYSIETINEKIVIFAQLIYTCLSAAFYFYNTRCVFHGRGKNNFLIQRKAKKFSTVLSVFLVALSVVAFYIFWK